jgi:Fic family protein
MLHQLHMMSVDDPREALLTQLASSEPSLPEVLSRLAAFHMASQEQQQPLREVTVHADNRFFPHPQDVPALLLFSLQKLSGFWNRCQSEEDDLYVVAFAMYALLAIHPFENANGRTSLDFVQYLLMKRWELEKPPLRLERNVHREIASYLAVLDEPNDGLTPEAFYALRLRLAQRLDQMTLSRLKASKPFQIVVSFFQKALSD